MKNPLITLFALLLLLPVVFAATSDNAVLKASITKYEPVPAEPGQYVTVYIDLENTGNADAKNVILEIVPEFPFAIDASAARKVIGIIGSGKDYVSDFKLRVNNDAIIGLNTIKIRYTPDGLSWIDGNLALEIKSSDADVQIVSATTSPEELIPGQSGILRVRVQNPGNTLLKDIKFKLDLATTTTVSYPFIIEGSGTEQRIAQLDPQETSEFIYTIKPYPDTASQLYKIPITLSYADTTGQKYTKSDILSIVINSKPELMVKVDDVRVDGTIIIKVINQGLSNIKLLNVQLGTGDGFTLASPSSSEYIGKLESDDFDTVNFKLTFTKDTITLPVLLTYRDANNQQYNETYKLDVKAFKQNGKGGSSSVIIIIVVVVVIGGFVAWRALRKRKPVKA